MHLWTSLICNLDSTAYYQILSREKFHGKRKVWESKRLKIEDFMTEGLQEHEASWRVILKSGSTHSSLYFSLWINRKYVYVIFSNIPHTQPCLVHVFTTFCSCAINNTLTIFTLVTPLTKFCNSINGDL